MTLLELIFRVRTRLDDLGGDTGTVPPGYTYYWEYSDAGRLWTNAELVGYINSARNELAQRLPIVDSTTEDLVQIALVADTATYDVDYRILAIDSVVLGSTGTPLVKLSDANDRSAWQDPYSTTWTGPSTVSQYRFDLNDYTLTVYATPTESDTLLLSVRRLPLDELLWTHRSWELDEPVATHQQLALVDWVCMQAYLKRDTDTFNADLAGRHQGLFTDAVGPRIQFTQAAVRKEVAGARLRTRAYY